MSDTKCKLLDVKLAGVKCETVTPRAPIGGLKRADAARKDAFEELPTPLREQADGRKR